nr:hypothetical protein [Methanosarcina flavescens]
MISVGFDGLVAVHTPVICYHHMRVSHYANRTSVSMIWTIIVM